MTLERMKEICDRSKALGTTFAAIAIDVPFKSMQHGEVGNVLSVDLARRTFVIHRVKDDTLIVGAEDDISLLEYMYSSKV